MNRFNLILGFVLALLVTAAVASAAPGQGRLLGTDASSGNLISIDPSTGIGTIIGPTGVSSLPSLAVNPNTGVIYTGSGGGAAAIYTIDPGTGAATLVGDTGLGFSAVSALDFDSAGTLWASVNLAGDGGTGSDHLATIDLATGAATIIGPYGICAGIVIPSIGGGSCSIDGMEALAFDAAGTLWGALSARAGAGTPGLYTIDTSTGVATFVAPLEDGTSTPASGGFVSLQFACDGTLYGGTARARGAGTDGGLLATINPTTGTFTFVGATSATGGSSLGALAFEDACTVPIPSLGTWGLLALATLLAAAAVFRFGMR